MLRTRRRLEIRRETLRALNLPALGPLRGGGLTSEFTASLGCSFVGCDVPLTEEFSKAYPRFC